ncbi:hypothetical protein [Nocardia sp. CA-290969]|uniref:hypothetical protein n=1 Tax=Nocardia sp. CA-290969 TaxID=3239986 RepID=UPI003D8ECFCB
MYRQGDVLIVPIAAENGAAAVERWQPAPRDRRGRMVLALGEVTGHAHAITSPGKLFHDPHTPNSMVLHLPEGGRLVHEEHAAIGLPKGWYRVVRQREYVPGAVRIVAD